MARACESLSDGHFDYEESGINPALLAEAKEKERRANLEAKAIAKGAEKAAAGPPSTSSSAAAAAAGRSGATTQRGEGKSTG